MTVPPPGQRPGYSSIWSTFGLGVLAALLLVHMALMQAEQHGATCQIVAPAASHDAPRHDLTPPWLSPTALVAALPHASASSAVATQPGQPPAPRTVLNGCPVAHAALPLLLLLLTLLGVAASGPWRANRPFRSILTPLARPFLASALPPGRRQALLQVFLR